MSQRSTEMLIENLSDTEKLQLIRDYEQFELDGFIDECALRTLAAKMSGTIGIPFWMYTIATECYRHFGNKWIRDNIDLDNEEKQNDSTGND